MCGNESEEKIICNNCGRLIIDEDTNFCPSCGTRLSRPQHLDSMDISPSENFPIKQHPKNDMEFPFAGFWIRLGAFWMDVLIVVLIAMFFGSLAYSTAIGRQLFPNWEKINLFMILLFIFYHSIFLGRFRTTPGKRFFGLSVIPVKPSSRFGFAEAALRTLSYFISEIFLGIGFFWIAFDRHKQGWHDKIAKTSVIRNLNVPLFRRLTTLILLTFLLIGMIALQFNITWVYQSVFNPGNRLLGNRGKEIISVLVTQKEIKTGIFKEINTRSGTHTIKLPSSARDGEIFKVNRSEEEGGIFYIKIVVVEII